MPDTMSRRFPVIDRLTAAPWRCLVRHGKLMRRNTRRAFVTDHELEPKRHEQAVRAIGTVKRAYLAADGERRLIRQESAQAAP